MACFVFPFLPLNIVVVKPYNLRTFVRKFKRPASLPNTCFLFWSIFLIFLSPAFSQSYIAGIQRFGIEKGLSHREVQCVFQDREGAIWVGTRYGLNRFDGYQFKNWQAEVHGQAVNYISRIGQDDESLLWIWNHKGILFLDPVTEKFSSTHERFGHDLPFDPELKAQRSWKYWDIRSIPADADGRLYLSNLSDAFFTFHSKEGFKKHQVQGAGHLEIADVDKTGHVWGLDGRKIILKMDGKGKVLERIQLSLPEAIPNNVLLAEGYLANFFEKGIPGFLAPRQNPKDRIGPEVPGRLEFINPVLKHFWIKGEDGYSVWSENGELLLKLSVEDLPGRLGNGFNHVITDKTGRMWIGSDFGLISIDIRPTKFKRHFYFDDESQKPFNNSARGMAADGDELLVNFEMGGLVSLPVSKPGHDFQLLDRNLGLFEGEAPVNGRQIKHLAIPILYITSYDDQATYGQTEATHLTGYLVKPLSRFTLKSSISLAIKNLQSAVPVLAETGGPEADDATETVKFFAKDALFFKKNSVFQKVEVKDIHYLEADGDYVLTYLGENEKFISRCTLSQMEELLPTENFMRVHRGFMVNLSKIQSIDFQEAALVVAGRTLPLNKLKLQELKEGIRKVS